VALALVAAATPKRVLDVGCGPGFVAKGCEALGCQVTGLDRVPPLPHMMSEFRQVDLDQEPLPVDPFAYDAILLLDVIEHLAEPEAFLVRLRNESRALRPGQPAPAVIVSVPNVGFAAVRLNLALGRFNYAERGILDITHKRLFTRATLLRMLRDCGYRVEKLVPVQVPFEAVMPGALGRALGRIACVLAYAWPPLFAFQFMAVCRPLPGVRQVLQSAERRTGQDLTTSAPAAAPSPGAARCAGADRDPPAHA
jgi:SAM-dependent methyltransferase